VRDARRSNGGHRPILWLVVLGACTLWLAMQNTLLVLAALWLEPGTTRALITALVQAVAHVIAGFWSSPAAAVLGVAVATVVMLRALAGPPNGEARHG
jgi:hypothetical protein